MSPAYHCPHCLKTFPDIWALKRHQNEKENETCPVPRTDRPQRKPKPT